MLKIFRKWSFSWNMLHIIYQHSWVFNLETLLMLGIFGKWPLSWICFSTIYQYNRLVDLINNFNNLIYNFKNPNCNIVANDVQLKTFLFKNGNFLLVTPWDVQALELSSKQVEGQSCSISNCFATHIGSPTKLWIHLQHYLWLPSKQKKNMMWKLKIFWLALAWI